MAAGLPTPKSREQLLSEMMTEYVSLTGINDLNTGSLVTQFFDTVARSVARNSGDVFQILRDYSVDRATGEALIRIGTEERIKKFTSRVATGSVTITDTSFDKISTKVYAGASAPNVGSTTILVSDASLFTATGSIYIGRGTPNVEGPIAYSAVAQTGSFWEITLSTPTTKFHNISESVILAQGGVRNIASGTVILAPGSGASPDVNYTVTSSAIILDGETTTSNVQIAAQQPGSLGNAPIGGIKSFSTLPFPNASVINTSPLSNGRDEETDDDYRDRIKKVRLSRGLGTALAVKNAVLGAQPSDENAVVTSNEINTANVEETILHVDNGEGYEEKTDGVGIEYMIESAIGGEQTLQLATGGRQTSVAKAFLESSLSAPFAVNPTDRLAILVGGIVSEHIFEEGDFKANGSATAYEIVSSINNNSDLTFNATTSDDGRNVVITAKEELNEYLQISEPSGGTDSAPVFGFPTNEVQTLLLYKNRQILNRNGRSALLLSKSQFDWSPSITNGDTLIIAVDGTAAITYTFTDADFLAEGQHTTVNSQNTLSSWINVINAKVTGVTAQINGEQIKLVSNLGASSRASLVIDASSDLVSKGIFASSLGLEATGDDADFEMSRNTAQVKLKIPLSEGDSLNAGSQFTKAEVSSSEILGGQITLSDTSYLWVLVDDKDAELISTGVTSESLLTITKPAPNRVRYTSSSITAFSNVEVGDYVIIWSEELSATNRLEGRVYASSGSYLEINVTLAEYSAAVAEGPIIFQEGFTVLRTDYVPQKIKLDTGSYNINVVAEDIQDQMSNAVVTVEDDEVIIIATNTQETYGAIMIVDFNDPAKALSFIKGQASQSIDSQFAFRESEFQDNQFPLFIHGEITQDEYADPPTDYIPTVETSENLDTLDFEPNGLLRMIQPYNVSQDIQPENESLEIEQIVGTTVTIENSPFYRRSRIGDRFFLAQGYSFGPNDTLVAILDDDATEKTFSIPLYRTAVTNTTMVNNANNFRAYDQEAGSTVEFEEFFGADFLFDNYKVMMHARNVIDPDTMADEDAVLYRSAEWGRSGEYVSIAYILPTSPNQAIGHSIVAEDRIYININLKSGAARTTTLDATTEWDVSVTPLTANTDLATYTYTGTGTAPGLGSVIAGDYVTILATSEFDAANIGTFKIYSATASSFTVKRPVGVALAENDKATLEPTAITFFQSTATTAAEVVAYVTASMSAYITAELIDDNGSTGSGAIVDSTYEDSDYTDEYVELVDGLNYILATDLDALSGVYQFSFKTPLTLPSYSTNTPNAYSFNDGEVLRYSPTTSKQVAEFLNILAVTGFTTLGTIRSINRNTAVEFATQILGSDGAIDLAGGSASSAAAAIDGSSSLVGPQNAPFMSTGIATAASNGFYSGQYVRVEAETKQKKDLLVDATNLIKVDANYPVINRSRIILSNRSSQQRLFGEPRYHTRTRGRTFKVEKQGQFVCISWDVNGTSPFISSQVVDINDSAPGTMSIYVDDLAGTAEFRIESGAINFNEVAIGDYIEVAGRANPENNGAFLILGKSDDGDTIIVRNEDAVNELATGTFTINNNVTVLGNSFIVGGFTFIEGVDFVVGATLADTASNLAAVLETIPNITATSSGAVVTVTSDLPNVSIAISTSGGGATASGSSLVAQSVAPGDLEVTSAVSEGDSVIISSDFATLNQGTYRIIRAYKESFYIDNPNAVEEEVTLADNLRAIGGDSLTEYSLTLDGAYANLAWTGVGAEPTLGDARPGDTIRLGTDFLSANQGDWRVLGAAVKLQEITKLKMPSAAEITTGEYLTINTAGDAINHYLWLNKDGGGGDPMPLGLVPIPVPISTGDTSFDIHDAIASVINTSFSASYTAEVVGDYLYITTVGYGPTTDAANVDIGGTLEIQIIQDGQRTSVTFVNANAATDTGVVITDVLEIHKEAMVFREYEATVPGDLFYITDSFIGEENVGSYLILDVIDREQIEIQATGMESLEVAQILDEDYNKIYVEEESPYVGYKQIKFISTNPANVNLKVVVFDTGNQYNKINELANMTMLAVGKLEYVTGTRKGLDAYRFHTGLIGESNRIVYGDPRDPVTYPGVAAAGAEIFIKAPLIKRIEVSIDVRVKTGIPFAQITEQVRNTIAALINSNAVGNPIAISNIISAVDAINGVRAVAITSPQYDSQNDIIRVNAGEKSIVLDSVADIIVSKID